MRLEFVKSKQCYLILSNIKLKYLYAEKNAKRNIVMYFLSVNEEK